MKTVTLFSKLLALVLFVSLPFTGFYLGMQYQKSITIPKSEVTTDKIVPSDPNLITYTSDKLGISFTYLKEQTGTNISVSELSNKVCITYASNDTDCSAGQSVEVFSKNKDETLEQAITRMFLKNKDLKKCFVTITNPRNYSTNFVKGEITFPQNENFDLEEMWENSDYCSKNYARTNGIRYFLEDTNHPSKFLFFSIGQYAIMSANDKTWQETIEVN